MATTLSVEDIAEQIRQQIRGEVPQAEEAVKPEELFDDVKFDTKGKKLLSKVFGIKIPEGLPDPKITVFKAEDWPEEVRGLIPDKDADYVFQVEQLIQLAIGLELGDNCWIAGPTGSGKTTLVQQFCAVVNRPFVRVNGRGDMESGPIFGQYTVENGQGTVWHDGACTEAVKVGAVYCQDEPTVLPPEIAMGYQWLLENEGKLFLSDKSGSVDDKIVKPHPQFRFVCCDNTRGLGDETGAYAGTQVWNSATLDRFSTTIHLGYLSHEHEENILTGKVQGCKPELAKRMVQFANLVREGYNEGSLAFTMSPRTLLSWGLKTTFYKDPAYALRVAFYEKLGAEDERQAVEQMYQTVFATTFIKQ